MIRVRERKEELVARARLHLPVYDEAGFVQYLQSQWSVDALAEMLTATEPDVAKVAAIGLGLLGREDSVPVLIDALGHEDAVVSAMVEFAVWSIWFQSRGSDAASRLRSACQLQHDVAGELLDRLVEQYPDWAEAYNQRAILGFRGRCYVSAIDDFREALAIMPHHFGALAGLGHAYAQVGCYSEALAYYRRALSIHPRMGGIRQSMRTVRGLMRLQSRTS